MKAYQSTAAQARFIDSLAKQVGDDTFRELFNKAARVNDNRGWVSYTSETYIRAARRLTKKVASQLIEALLEAKNNPKEEEPEVIEETPNEPVKIPEIFLCPQCHSTELEANTWEAWCYECDWRIEEETSPELFKDCRKQVEARREVIGKVLDELVKKGIRL